MSDVPYPLYQPRPQGKRNLLLIGSIGVAVILIGSIIAIVVLSSKNTTTVASYRSVTESNVNLSIPTSWLQYYSKVYNPGYTVREDPSWTITQDRLTALFTLPDKAQISIARQVFQSKFSSPYSNLSLTSSRKGEVIDTKTYTLNGQKALRYEVLTGVGTSQELYTISTEVLAGGARWFVNMSTYNPQVSVVNSDKTAYFRVLSTFIVH